MSSDFVYSSRRDFEPSVNRDRLLINPIGEGMLIVRSGRYGKGSSSGKLYRRLVATLEQTQGSVFKWAQEWQMGADMLDRTNILQASGNPIPELISETGKPAGFGHVGTGRFVNLATATINTETVKFWTSPALGLSAGSSFKIEYSDPVEFSVHALEFDALVGIASDFPGRSSSGPSAGKFLERFKTSNGDGTLSTFQTSPNQKAFQGFAELDPAYLSIRNANFLPFLSQFHPTSDFVTPTGQWPLCAIFHINVPGILYEARKTNVVVGSGKKAFYKDLTGAADIFTAQETQCLPNASIPSGVLKVSSTDVDPSDISTIDTFNTQRWAVVGRTRNTEIDGMLIQYDTIIGGVLQRLNPSCFGPL